MDGKVRTINARSQPGAPNHLFCARYYDSGRPWSALHLSFCGWTWNACLKRPLYSGLVESLAVRKSRSHWVRDGRCSRPLPAHYFPNEKPRLWRGFVW